QQQQPPPVAQPTTPEPQQPPLGSSRASHAAAREAKNRDRRAGIARLEAIAERGQEPRGTNGRPAHQERIQEVMSKRHKTSSGSDRDQDRRRELERRRDRHRKDGGRVRR
ncbi:MAG: hypothetical protein L6R36_009243, partial [Xanthoria steineri]